LLDKSIGKFNQWLVNTHYFAGLEDRINQIHRQKGFNTDPKF
jgi:hypothetical protein